MLPLVELLARARFSSKSIRLEHSLYSTRQRARARRLRSLAVSALPARRGAMSGVMPTPVVDGNDSDDWPVPPMRGSARSRDRTTPGFGPQGVAPNKPRPPDAGGTRTRLCATLEWLDAQMKLRGQFCREVQRHHVHSVQFLWPRCYEIVRGVEMNGSAEIFRG